MGSDHQEAARINCLSFQGDGANVPQLVEWLMNRKREVVATEARRHISAPAQVEFLSLGQLSDKTSKHPADESAVRLEAGTQC